MVLLWPCEASGDSIRFANLSPIRIWFDFYKQPVLYGCYVCMFFSPFYMYNFINQNSFSHNEYPLCICCLIIESSSIVNSMKKSEFIGISYFKYFIPFPSKTVQAVSHSFSNFTLLEQVGRYLIYSAGFIENQVNGLFSRNGLLATLAIMIKGDTGPFYGNICTK